MEETQGMSQGQGTTVSQPATTSQTSQSAAPLAATPPASEERTFRQAEVSDLVRRAKNDAVDAYRRQQQEQPQYLEQKYGDSRPQNQQFSHQVSNDIAEDRIRRLAAEEAQRHIDGARQEAFQKSQDEMAQRTVQNFWSKISAGKEKYQDFDKVTGDIDYQRFPNVVQLLGDYLENSGDVLYELGKDRIKMANLEVLAEKSPRDAITAAQRLSQSIKDNEAASNTRIPNKPLSQMRPSNTGTDSGGAMSVRDYRNKYRM